MFFSCSTYVVEKVYDNLDWLAINEIDDYFDLNEKQDDYLEKEFAEVLNWHKHNELPFFKDTLLTIKNLVNAEQISSDQINKIRLLFSKTKKEYILKLEPVIVSFLRTVDKAQLEYLKEELQEYNNDHEEELTDTNEKEYFEEKLKDAHDDFEDRTGSITDEQREILRNYGGISYASQLIRAEQRKIYQKAFLTFMDSSPNEPAIKAIVINWLLNPQELMTPETIQSKDKGRAIRNEYYLKMHKTLSHEQKKELSEQIDDYIHFIDGIRK